MLRRLLVAAVTAAAVLAAAPPAAAQIVDLNAAINKAGCQRMLSQRMAKAYLQIWQRVEAERSRRILDASIALFDRQLVELKNYAPTPEVRATYLRLEKSWLAYKVVLVGSVASAEGAQRMAKFYNALSWGVPFAPAKGELEKARQEFVRALADLSSAPLNTADVRDELDLARQQWLFFENAVGALGRTGDRKRDALDVATSSERLLEVMDRVTGMYERL